MEGVAAVGTVEGVVHALVRVVAAAMDKRVQRMQVVASLHVLASCVIHSTATVRP
jgi:hypothetical protein